MKRLRSTFVLVALVALVASANTASALDDKQPVEGTVSGGNSIYSVHVQDIAGLGVGLYTATTGAGHPSGSGLNVLFGGGAPGTTFNTIRSYTTGTDYVQDGFKSSVNAVVLLGPFGSVTPIGATGFRTTYVLPGPPVTPDALTIISDVNVNGTTFADSTVEVTTTVMNNGASPVDIGIRYHWDFQIGSDDGPTFQEISPNGAVRILESEFLAPVFDSYRIEDNDTNASPPTFNVLGTVTGPPTVVPTPTAPDLLQYVCWPSAFGTAFEYTVNPARDIATTASDCRGSAGGDVAVHYFFGHDAASATSIAPATSHTVSASLFLTPPAPSVIEVDIDIKPGSDPNSINPKSMGFVPVAILGSETFDVTTVDVTTLAFGPNGAAPRHDLTDALVYADHLQDVNGDGFTDLVSHYRQKETGLASGDAEACLTGEAGGIPLEGCDSVRVLGG